MFSVLGLSLAIQVPGFYGSTTPVLPGRLLLSCTQIPEAKNGFVSSEAAVRWGNFRIWSGCGA